MLSKGDIIFCEWNGILQMRMIERVEGSQAYSGYQKFRRIPLSSGQILQLGGMGAADIRFWIASKELLQIFKDQNRGSIAARSTSGREGRATIAA